MNSGVYMRKLQRGRTQTIGFQNGQDASQVTLKNQAKAQSVPIPVAVVTSFSRIGGTVGNIMEATQQTSSPTNQSCLNYKGVSYEPRNADTAGNLIGSKQFCAVSSDAPSSAPYNIVLPCKPFINPIAYNVDSSATAAPSITLADGTIVPTTSPGSAPPVFKCCTDDTSQLFRDNSELIRDQGRQLQIRRGYNLPAKLQGLRGPILSRN